MFMAVRDEHGGGVDGRTGGGVMVGDGHDFTDSGEIGGKFEIVDRDKGGCNGI